MSPLPIPPHFDPDSVGSVWRVDYGSRAPAARDWAGVHGIRNAAEDERRICVVLVDCQNTFCIPGYELFVGGRSGRGAVDDNRRLCEFLYRHLDVITEIAVTLDSHTALQIFHPVFWVDERGRHPDGAATVITAEDVERGRWRVNPAVAPSVANGDVAWLERYVLHYVRALAAGHYPLMVWPYHAMLGGVGHALVSAVEEAAFVHGIARQTATRFEMKGGNPLTEHYSVLSPEVLEGPGGFHVAARNVAFIDHLLAFDAVIVAGQAKSHCVAWTISDLLREIRERDPALAGRIYLLDDGTSPVVVPGVADFTDHAERAFAEFAAAGMRIVRSTEPLDTWDGFPV
jgi:nicotinamidase-related amidase